MYEGPLLTNVKSVKTSILVLKVIQGHCFRCQSKPVYDFLLVINCNLGPISHLSRSVSEIWRLLGRNPYRRGRYSRSRSSKVIVLGLNGKPIGEFLLVINCNLGPVSHRFRDVATSRLKSLPPRAVQPFKVIQGHRSWS